MGVVAAIGLGVAVAGLAVSVKGAADAKSAQKKVGLANKKIAALENARSRRQQIREANIAEGTVAARAAVSGGGGGFGNLGSSSARGQKVGIKSQLTSNLKHLDESTRLSSIASNQAIKAAGARSTAAIGGAISQAGLTTANLFGKGGAFEPA